jgi:hypothetical protein
MTRSYRYRVEKAVNDRTVVFYITLRARSEPYELAGELGRALGLLLVGPC